MGNVWCTEDSGDKDIPLIDKNARPKWLKDHEKVKLANRHVLYNNLALYPMTCYSFAYYNAANRFQYSVRLQALKKREELERIEKDRKRDEIRKKRFRIRLLKNKRKNMKRLIELKKVTYPKYEHCNKKFPYFEPLTPIAEE